MAKRIKRRSQKQLDKNLISAAKRGKELGLISKQAKLHSGNYISKALVKKVEALLPSIALGYKAHPVRKSQVKLAQLAGYQTIGGNRIVGPSTPAFRKRIKEQDLVGVLPVKGGMMEQVELPHSVFDLKSLVARLGLGIDELKMPDEYFAFTYDGGTSRKVFRTTQDMLDYLMQYKEFMDFSSTGESMEFEKVVIFRMNAKTIHYNIPTEKQRKETAKWKRMEAIRNGTYIKRATRKKTRAQWIEGLPDWRREKELALQKARQDAYNAKKRDDPIYKEKKRKAAAQWRAKQKTGK